MSKLLISRRLEDNYSEQKKNYRGKKVSIVLIAALHLNVISVEMTEQLS